MTDSDNQGPGRQRYSNSHLAPLPLESPLEETSAQSYQLSSASSYSNLQYLFGVQDLAMNAPKPTSNRRKSEKGPEHTKHRRTRSGCYTCRSRRVKVFIPS